MSFDFDVYLCYSQQDKPVVQVIAERIRASGVRVWFDEWELPKGGSLEDGLNRSRLMIFFGSLSSYGSDWQTLRPQTLRFFDPLSLDQRGLIVKLENPTEQTFLQGRGGIFVWDNSEKQFANLLDICRAQRRELQTESPWMMDLAHTAGVESVSLSSDGRWAVSGSDDKIVRFWDLQTGACLHALPGHTGEVYQVAMTSDGSRAVSCSADATLRLWDRKSGDCIAKMPWPEGFSYKKRWSKYEDYDSCYEDLEVSCVDINPDGRYVVSGANDGGILFWDVQDNVWHKMPIGHEGDIRAISINSDGTRAVSGSDDGTVRLWDLRQRVCLRVMEGDEDDVWSVSMSSDGLRAVSAGRGHSVWLWDLASGTCLYSLKGHTREVDKVSITADGKRAVSVSENESIRLWDLDLGVRLKTIDDSPDGISIVSISPDGKTVYATNYNGLLKIWETSIDSYAVVRQPDAGSEQW